MNLGQTVVPENKEELITKQNKMKYHTQLQGMARAQKPTERAPDEQNWNNSRSKINHIVLDSNIKYKTNRHESVLTYK